MSTLVEIFIKIFVEAILISGVIGYFITKREERLRKTIEEELKKRDMFFNTRFNYKLRALEELLAPVKLQLIRSKIALQGYNAGNEYREKILKECNETIRKVLLEKGHLILPDLIPYTEKFISHYGEWLQAYQQAREIKNDKAIKHVVTYNFPHDAEGKFIEKYNAYRQEPDIEGSLN